MVGDTTNLEGSIWTWWRENGTFHCRKTATIPPEPAKKDQLPPLWQGFEAVPPLVTDIDLSLDDRFLYVSCCGTGELRQYDVSDPMEPKVAGSVHIGGHHAQDAAPRRRFPQRSANGRDQSRRQTRLLDRLAVLDMGRPVLSGRRSGRDGQGRCACDGGGLTLDKRLLCRVPERVPFPPDSVSTAATAQRIAFCWRADHSLDGDRSSGWP